MTEEIICETTALIYKTMAAKSPNFRYSDVIGDGIGKGKVGAIMAILRQAGHTAASGAVGREKTFKITTDGREYLSRVEAGEVRVLPVEEVRRIKLSRATKASREGERVAMGKIKFNDPPHKAKAKLAAMMAERGVEIINNQERSEHANRN